MSLQGLLNKTATIQRNTTTIGNDGNAASSWANSSTGVKCTIQPISGMSNIDAVGAALGAQFKAYFEYPVDLRPFTAGGVADRVVVDSIAYSVVYVEDMAGRVRFKKAYLKLAG